MGRLDAEIALVTGASRGIGRAIALAFAKEGADVLVNYNESHRKAKEVVGAIHDLGRHALGVKADVARPSEVKRMVRTGLREFGHFDILVNNAGIFPDFSLKRPNYDLWQRMIDVNVKGALLCAAAVAPSMRRRRRGAIINVSSISGMAGGTGYGMTKAALNGLTLGLARELAPHIRVNAIAPGVVDTGWVSEMTPKERRELLKELLMKRWGEPEDIAPVAVFLASDDSRYMTGATIVVDGGELAAF